MNRVPLIDLAAARRGDRSERRSTAGQIDEACQAIGFFAVTGHGVPDDLVDELYRCGSLPGHARAFRSLCLQWQTWLSARSEYASIEVPVTLAYGNHDWSRQPEREANEHAIPGVRALTFDGCGHFSCLEKPSQIAQLIQDGN